MSYTYQWKNKEANFASPVETEISGGTHISIECILKYQGKYIALRRPQAVPEHEIPKKAQESAKPCLYDVHGLPRWGETTEQCVTRLVKEQAGVGVAYFRTAYLDMNVHPETKQWSIEPVLFVEVDALPIPGIYGNEVVEVVTFDKQTVPEDFGWWSKEQIKEFLQEND